jgi:hypothetical protein
MFLFCSMMRMLRIRDYPYVLVRFACRDCPRVGRYRLAVLAERFGATADMADVLEAIASSCPRQREGHPARRCEAFYPDLHTPPPPDWPEALPRRFSVVRGGKKA